MKIKNREIDLKRLGRSLLCIGMGTAVGLVVYGIFLYFHIAIFGWNLGLIFAPLSAGYVETIASRRILGKDIGAVSAFILFIHTTFYSFILKNPTLGVNIITAGSIIVILQSAFPTLVNYILLVVIGAVVSNFKWVFLKIGKTIKSHIRWETTHEVEDEEVHYFDENESNEKLNSLNFFFMTSTDMKSSHEITGIYQSAVIVKKNDTISVKREEIENEILVRIKEGKDSCLIKLVDMIKADGGNGILDLNIQYGLIGRGKDCIHVTATGMGINIKNIK